MVFFVFCAAGLGDDPAGAAGDIVAATVTETGPGGSGTGAVVLEFDWSGVLLAALSGMITVFWTVLAAGTLAGAASRWERPRSFRQPLAIKTKAARIAARHFIVATLCHEYEGTDAAREASPTLIPAYLIWGKRHSAIH